MHNKIYLVYSLFIFLVGMGFFIAGEFNRPEKPELRDPDLIGHEDEENEEGDELVTEPGVSELSADEVEMPVAETQEPDLENIALDNEEQEQPQEESEEESEEKDEEKEPPIYDGHEEERIEVIKENYVLQERYDSFRWTTYIGYAFWGMALICAILYFTS